MGKVLVLWLAGGENDNFDDQTMLAVAIHRLLDIKPKNVSVIVAEHAASLSELTPYLQEQLRRGDLKKVIFSKNEQSSSTAPGWREFALFKQILAECGKLIKNYDWIVCLDSATPLTHPLLFKYLEQFNGVDAIVTNPEIILSSDQRSAKTEDIYTHRLFALKQKVFLKYVESMTDDQLKAPEFTLERHLHKFVQEQVANYKEVERLGILFFNRIDNIMQIL